MKKSFKLNTHNLPAKFQKNEEIVRMLAVSDDFSKFLNSLHFCKIDTRDRRNHKDYYNLIKTKKKIKLSQKRLMIVMDKKIKELSTNE